ncbi:hypothetical protein HPP92_000679 [Vanilla planifolia]|uniref:Reverse transcriptase domain-containing protein n=1 Tax=Vanilla planifolia TaxID=51239 RepID=A0A835SAL3_VANPL|nr:hypothetical protein HPP92_000679 [Vanilla planifolia]
MPEKWKETLVVLIPKRRGACMPTQFRPISLCNTIYKIVARVLVERLKPLMPHLISREQGAFIPGRCISDNIFIAQEMAARMHSCSSRYGLMAVKIDMMQAYDNIRWDFLIEMLKILRFPPLWCDWITACIQSPSFGVLVNGVRLPWVQAHRGLRQGCPLSPYLYVIASEFLSALMHEYETKQLLGFRPGQHAPMVSHLLYADDVLIYGHATRKAARSIRSVTQRFSKAAGLLINFSKSSVHFSRRSSTITTKKVAKKLRMVRGSSLNYLGVPIAAKRLKLADLNFLIQRMEACIAGWRIRPLSLAGRVSLANSVLNAIPTYILRHCTVPAGVIEVMERRVRNFLWNGASNTHMIHYAPWSCVTLPRNAGGLGLRDFRVWQHVLMMKQCKRVLCREDRPWVDIFRRKHVGNLLTSKIPWNLYYSGKLVLEAMPTAVVEFVWRIGDGKEARFEEDNWLGFLPICIWPTLINMKTGWPARVADCINEEGEWDVSSIRIWASDMLIDRILHLPRARSSARDMLVQVHTETEKIDNGKIYCDLKCRQGVGAPTASWWSSNQMRGLWKLKTLPRVRLFLWRVVGDYLPTATWLARRGMAENRRCVWGCEAEETAHHVFWSCPQAQDLWRNIIVRDAVVAVKMNPADVEVDGAGSDFIRQFMAFIGSPAARNGGGAVHAATVATSLYYLWGRRNAKRHSVPTGNLGTLLRNIKIEIAAVADQSNIHASMSRGNLYSSPELSVTHCWVPPPTGWIKVNCDAACGLHSAGIGVVVRDHMGKPLLAMGRRFVSQASEAMEVQAILEAFHLLRRSLPQYRAVEMQTDCMTAMLTVRKLITSAPETGPLAEIIRCARELDALTITHIYREGNEPADWVARAACCNDFVWDTGTSYPKPLIKLMLLDFMYDPP